MSKIAVSDVGGPGEPLKKVDTYDLLNPQDYKAFAEKHGEALARTIRFGLAYGCNTRNLKAATAVAAKLTGPESVEKLTKVDFAALEAAYGQGDKR